MTELSHSSEHIQWKEKPHEKRIGENIFIAVQLKITDREINQMPLERGVVNENVCFDVLFF